MKMFQGFPLRKVKWDDQILMWIASPILFPLIASIPVGLIIAFLHSDVPMEQMEETIMSYEGIISAVGMIGSLLITSIIVYARKIPVINRKQLSPKEWSFLPGLDGNDWRFLAWYIPVSFVLFNIGAFLIETVLGEGEHINQEAIENMFVDMPLVVMFIMIVIAAPIVEEWLFRGIIFFRKDTNQVSWLTVILTSIFFGLVHMPTTIQAGYTYIGLGLIMGYAAKHTKSVEAAIVYHFLNNLLGFIVLLVSS